MAVLSSVTSQVRDMGELLALVIQENDQETLESIEHDLAQAQSKIEDLEFRRMFSNPVDKNG